MQHEPEADQLESMSKVINTGSSLQPAFVGRHRELAAISAALQDAQGGRGGLLLLIGEAGVGKTRTAEEIASLAARGGFHVWWGHCHEDQGMPPYWPWMELLRSCLRDDATGDAARQAGVAAQLAELVPEFITRKPSGRELADSDDSARFRLFHAVASTLEQAARQVPILAVIEDLHWSDEASAALLTFVARRATSSRLLLFGTSRDEVHGGGRSTNSWLPGPGARTLPLDGLTRHEVELLVSEVSHCRPDAALLAALHDRTAGNPFFITEIARWMMTRPTAKAGDAPILRIPGSVWSIIRRGLDQLPQVTRRTMQTAAALGGEFDVGLLYEVCDDETRARLPVALTEAAAGNVIRQRTASGFAFRHPLIRQALYEEIAPAARIQLHGRIADAYRDTVGRGTESSASEIAHHLARAGAERDADLALYSRLAGEQALATCAYAEAVVHFERALRGTTRPIDAPSASVFVNLGRALAATSLRWNRQRASEYVSRAVEYYVANGSIAEAVAAATDASLLPEGIGRITPTLERLLGAVSPDSVESGWLHARYGAAIFFETGNYERARGQLMRALALADAAGDAALELRTLSYATAIDHFAVRWSGLLGECHRVIELARRVDDSHAETYARYRAAYTLAFSGHHAEARLQASLNVAQAERLADPGLIADALYVRMFLAQFAGDWDAARELAARGLEVSPHHLPILQLRAVLEFATGNEEAGRTCLDRLCDAAAHAGPYPLRGALHTLALTQIAELRDEQLQRPAAEPSSIPMAALLSETVPAAFAAIRENDSGRAAAAVTALAPYAGIIVATPLVTDRLLGRLAAVAGDDLQAARHYENALAFCRRAGYQPELAWTCYDYARFLLTRNRSPLHQTADALTLEARTLATTLGLPPLLKRVEALQTEQGELRGDGPGNLTPREVEILRLISTGQTNKAIAKQLDISRNTVAVHVSRILAKTGARNRTEAARLARTSLPQ